MPYPVAPHLGAHSLAISPATGLWTPAKSTAFSHNGSPFQQLFSEQLRWMQASIQPGSLIPQTSPTAMALPRQAIAATGGGLPFALPGAAPTPAITVESFTYTRVTFGNDGLLRALDGVADVEPRSLLAEVLAGLSAPPPETSAVDRAHAPLPTMSAKEAVGAGAAQTPGSEADELADPAHLGDKLTRSVAKFSESGMPNAEFAVDHPRYGRIEAGVEISDGQVRLAFGIEDPALRAALESVRGALEQALSDKGLTLVAFDVGTPEQSPGTRRAVSAAALLASAYGSEPDTALSRNVIDMAREIGERSA